MGDNGKKRKNRKTSKSTPQKGGTANQGKKIAALDNTDKDIEDKNIAYYREETNTSQDTGENEPGKATTKKNASVSKPTVQLLEKISPVYQKMETSCKVLYALVVSISKASKSKVLENKEVIDNFILAQQIFEGLTHPQNAPKSASSSKGKKRKTSIPPPNVEESITKIQELESKIAEYQQNQQKLESERDKMMKDLEIANKFKEKDSNNVKLLTEANDNVQSLQGQIEIMKKQLESEKHNHQEILADLQSNLKSTELCLTEKNEQLQSLSEQLIERSNYIERIRNEIENLKSDRDDKIEELNELRNRLSRMSASKLDGDPNITDLGDPNRPLKLVERYQQLYDNLWTDAFGELIDSYTEINNSYEKEKKAASEIITVFQGVIQFCEDVIRDQERTILSTLLCCTNDELDGNKAHIHISTFTTIRKSIVRDTIPRLYKEFMNRQRNHDVNDCMRVFIEECLAICWTSLVQDPPMAFELAYCHGSVVDKDVMREFTVSGDQVDFVVWPAMRLTQSGPIMVKSVVQPIKKDSMKAN